MPTRKFDPTPLETTQKSSTTQSSSSSSTQNEPPPKRRFAPQVVETSQKSTKDTDKPRRFTPQVVESSQKSSKSGNDAPRRFTPQVVESSSKSSSGSSGKEKNGAKPRIKFAPQPFETTHSSNRASSAQDDEPTSPGASTDSAAEKKPARKFQPDLIDTAQRSRRSTTSDSLSVADLKTESGHLLHAREHRRHITGSRTPVEDGESGQIPQSPRWIPPEQRRPVSPLDGSRRTTPSCLVPERQHSFRCPDLDTIESSESERSVRSSRSSSPGEGSPNTASDSSFVDYYKHATRIRESVDENFSQYLRELEAKKAQKRLQEQALAAFPNSDFHEPVQHYVNNDADSDEMDEIEDRPVTWEGFDEDEILERFARHRRESTKTPWEQLEMQRHAEKLEKDRRANESASKQNSQSSPWWSAGAGHLYEQDNEVRSMRDRARPPMLGRDLKFPRCPSPASARFDVTQGPAALRKQMSEGEDSDPGEKPEEGGLWSVPVKKASPVNSASSANGNDPDVTGLWGGFCAGNEGETATPGLAPPSHHQTGLMTPRNEPAANPFDQSFAAPAPAPGTVQSAHVIKTPSAPPTPPRSGGIDMGSLNSILVQSHEQNQQIEEEFPDSFITQVYNYLSLGYPSLARPYDAELAKIARVSIADLRSDDAKAKQTPRGYIRLGSDFEGGGGEGMTEESCARWQALKLYIHEWARQEKNGMQSESAGGNWATVARRGSWAI